MELRGRVALVTGAGRRVGRALAVALGREGARVAVHFHGSERGARDTESEIVSAGGVAEIFRGDLTRAGAAEELIGAVTQRFGGLDILINSAAIMERTPFGQVSAEQWDRIMALNLRAPFLLSQAAAASLRASRGAIVNIADLAAYETWPAYIPHGISKGGVVHMTRSLARVLAPEVRVNAIAPGTVLLPDDWGQEDADRLDRTTPLRRQGSPDDVVSTMLFLLKSDYITGETIIVDGGRHIRR